MALRAIAVRLTSGTVGQARGSIGIGGVVRASRRGGSPATLAATAAGVLKANLTGSGTFTVARAGHADSAGVAAGGDVHGGRGENLERRSAHRISGAGKNLQG